MFLEELSLTNFRNLKRQKIKFKNSVNVFFGNNAQGKTNLLEAIYLVSTGKSFRTRSDHELITWGEKECRLKAQVGFLDIEVSVTPEEKKLLINNQQSKLTELIGSFITVTFTPTDIEIISGSPDRRRKFLDQVGSILERKYLFDLIQLSKVLKNRNQVLWQLKQGRAADLNIWNQQLVSVASSVWAFRAELVQKINEQLKTLSKKLSGGSLTVVYAPPFDPTDKKKLEESYLAKLSSLYEQEVSKAVTLLGPQRDDFQIIFEELKGDKIVSKDLGIYGSRGEQRTAALALKLSEVNLIEREKSDKPVLLLDEVLSELDKKHREVLIREVRKMQTFITTTSMESFTAATFGQLEKFEVSDGSITQR